MSGVEIHSMSVSMVTMIRLTWFCRNRRSPASEWKMSHVVLQTSSFMNSSMKTYRVSLAWRLRLESVLIGDCRPSKEHLSMKSEEIYGQEGRQQQKDGHHRDLHTL